MSLAEPIALASLPFDLYQRHKLVQEAVERIRDGRPRLSILDVGGSPGHLAVFLPHDRVVVADREGGPGEVALLAEAFALPFPNASFDVVVSLDTLEHVPGERRHAFVAELGRVTRDALLLAAPFHSSRVAEAESILAGFLQHRLKLDHRFLQEHLEHGLPDRAAIARVIAEHVGPVVAIPNGCLDRWLLMMGLSFYLDADPSLAELKRQISALYNRSYYRSDNAEPAYRYLLAARRPPGGPLEPAGLVAPAGDGSRLDFTAMAALIEVTGVDLLKEAYRSIAILKQEIGNKDVHAANLQAERARLQGEVQRLVDTTQSWQKHEANLGAERERLQGEVQRLVALEEEGQRREAELRAEGERLQGEVQRLAETNQAGHKREADLQGERARLEGEVRRLLAANLDLQAREAELAAHLASLRERRGFRLLKALGAVQDSR